MWPRIFRSCPRFYFFSTFFFFFYLVCFHLASHLTFSKVTQHTKVFDTVCATNLPDVAEMWPFCPSL